MKIGKEKKPYIMTNSETTGQCSFVISREEDIDLIPTKNLAEQSDCSMATSDGKYLIWFYKENENPELKGTWVKQV